ncbi:hypothetical protein Dimus_027922 [Dionaea muscipula]
MDRQLIESNSDLEPVDHQTTSQNFDFDSNFDSSESKKKMISPARDGVIVDPPVKSQRTHQVTQEHQEQKEKKQPEQIQQREKSDQSGATAKQSALQNFVFFKRSAAPVRLMYLENDSWKNFPTEVLELAKSAFQARNPVVEIQVDGNKSLIDFYRMSQTDISNGVERSIAWIDVGGKCYFPKFFVVGDGNDDYEHCVDTNCNYRTCNCSGLPKIDVEVRFVDGGNSTNGKRNREVKLDNERGVDDTANSSSSSEIRESKRRLLDIVKAGNSRWPNSRLVGEDEKVYSIVRDLFMVRMKNLDPSVEITSIHQFLCDGPMEKARWDVFKKHEDAVKKARGSSNTVFAWHGAAKNDVFNILANGFGLPNELFGSQAHGIGVYLSPAADSPQMSNLFAKEDENGEHHVVLCRAILGNVEQVEAGSQQTHPSSPSFDSGVDDVGNPKCYVIWSTNVNTRIFPECIVSYKFSDGPETHGDFTKWVPNASSSTVVKLFSKLGTLLPPPKLEELKSLCRTYKGGKMDKPSFIKKLRSIVGDGILHSAIREVRGMI